MAKTKKINIFFFIGLSAAGKDFYSDNLINQFPNNFKTLISFTSRPKREGEIDGKQYFYRTVDDWTRDVNTNICFETTDYANNKYWYTTEQLKDLENNVNLIFKVTPDGAEQILDFFKNNSNFNMNFNLIFLDCDLKTQLIRMITRDNNISVEEIEKRIVSNKEIRDGVDKIKKRFKDNNKLFFTPHRTSELPISLDNLSEFKTKIINEPELFQDYLAKVNKQDFQAFNSSIKKFLFSIDCLPKTSVVSSNKHVKK